MTALTSPTAQITPAARPAPRTVAVLGTGIMGAAMARNIAAAGHTVRAWNRTPERARPLAADGIEVVDTVARAVEGADVVLTMVFDAAAVAEVMEQAGPALRDGAAWIQATTVGVGAVAGLADIAAEHKVLFYDAPVSGTRGPAQAGELVVIAAGPTDGRGLVQPVFDAIGRRTIWTGEDGSAGTATRLKLVVNSWVIAASNAAGEAVALSGALGVDPRQFLDLVVGGPLDMPFMRVKAELVMDENFSPANFAVDTSGKDAHLIVDVARRAGLRLDGMEAFAARLDRVAAAGRSADDMAAAYLASFGRDEEREVHEGDDGAGA